jgi:prenyltransferase beta subunit
MRDLTSILLSFSIPGLTHWQQNQQSVTLQVDDNRLWRSPYRRASSADVEMTAYALMASIVRMGRSNIAALTPIVQWLTKQRNANGGFSSTQVNILLSLSSAT